MVALLAACSGKAPDRETTVTAAPPDAGPTETRAPAPSPTPASEAAVTLAALSAADVPALIQRVGYSPVPCSNTTWPFPRCAPGEPEGASVARFPFLGCEPAFLDPGETATVLRQVISGRQPALRMLASFDGPEPQQYFPFGPLAALFSTQPPPGLPYATGFIAILDAEGRLLSLRTGCRLTPDQLHGTLPPEAVIDGVTP